MCSEMADKGTHPFTTAGGETTPPIEEPEDEANKTKGQVLTDITANVENTIATECKDD